MKNSIVKTPIVSRLERVNLSLKTGQTTSYGSGAGLDDGALQVGNAKSYTVLTAGQYAGTTNITINGKTDVHSNACVQDNKTGLMWLQTVSASVGPASDGLLPWTTTGAGATAEGIFPYVVAANAAGLAGHSDWRVPNVNELFSLADSEAPSGVPDAAAFPSFPANNVWTSTTRPNNTANAQCVNFSQAVSATLVKTSTAAVVLVRGGL